MVQILQMGLIYQENSMIGPFVIIATIGIAFNMD